MIETLYSLAQAAGHDLKAVAASFDTQSHGQWLRENGYRELAAQYGWGAMSASGANVNEETALESSAVYACVKIIAEDMGALPFFVYERAKDRQSASKAYTHPLFRVLHNLVNPDLEAGVFVEALTAHAALCGNGFAEIQRVGNTIYLWPWMPGEVRIDKNRSGRVFYLRRAPGESEKTYASDRVFHLKGFSLDFLQGDQIIKRARQVIGLTLSTQDYASRAFAQDQTPPFVIEFPAGSVKGPEYVKNVKKAWAEHHAGPLGWHIPAVIADGGQLKPMQRTHAETQLIEQRRFQLLEVCRLFRMPPHKLADLERATFSNIEQQGIEYVQHTLNPWVERWSRSVYRCLLTEQEQDTDRIYAEHNVEALQRGDFAAQAEGWRKLLEKGVYCINDVLKMLNMPPVPGGDQRFIQLNLGTVQDVAAGLTLKPANGTLPVGGTP